MIGAPIEDTMAILHLITHGIPSRYSAHEDRLGGEPMMLQRLANQYRWGRPQLQREASRHRVETFTPSRLWMKPMRQFKRERPSPKNMTV
jgi:hypothetical protein